MNNVEFDALAHIAVVIGSVVFAIGAAWATVKFRVRHLERDNKDLKGEIEDLETKLGKALYREDGGLIYMMREECGSMQAKCEASICRKVDELKVQIHAEDNKIEKGLAQLTRTIIQADQKRENTRVEFAQMKVIILQIANKMDIEVPNGLLNSQ